MNEQNTISEQSNEHMPSEEDFNKAFLSKNISPKHFEKKPTESSPIIKNQRSTQLTHSMTDGEGKNMKRPTLFKNKTNLQSLDQTNSSGLGGMGSLYKQNSNVGNPVAEQKNMNLNKQIDDLYSEESISEKSSI